MNELKILSRAADVMQQASWRFRIPDPGVYHGCSSCIRYPITTHLCQLVSAIKTLLVLTRSWVERRLVLIIPTRPWLASFLLLLFRQKHRRLSSRSFRVYRARAQVFLSGTRIIFFCWKYRSRGWTLAIPLCWLCRVFYFALTRFWNIYEICDSTKYTTDIRLPGVTSRHC